MCSMCMQEIPKLLDRAQHLQRLQSAPVSFAMLAVQLLDRAHQQRGNDSRRCPRFVHADPKDLRRGVRPLCTTCTQIRSKFGQSLVKFCSQTAGSTSSWQYPLTPAAMQYTAPKCWQHPCSAPARQTSLASTCSALRTQRFCPPCGIVHLRLLPLHARLGTQICSTGRFVRSHASASESSIPSEVKLCSLDPSS